VELSLGVTGEVDGIFLFTRTPGTQELKEFVMAFRIL
jgi:hypothetical protein